MSVLMILNMDADKRSNGQPSPAHRLSNGYMLPEGTLTPNTVFVGGIDVDVDERELCNIFSRFGAVKEVKLINYTRGMSRKYGFVYFKDDVNISALIEQEITFKGQTLKLGPAITKARYYRSRLPCHVCRVPWAGTPPQCFFTGFCPSVAGAMAQPTPGLNGCNPYSQPYSYSNGAGAAAPQVPMTYTPPYAYQYPQGPWMMNPRTQHVNQVEDSSKRDALSHRGVGKAEGTPQDRSRRPAPVSYGGQGAASNEMSTQLPAEDFISCYQSVLLSSNPQ